MLSSNGTIFTTEHEGVIPGTTESVGIQNVKNFKHMLKKAKDAGNATEIEYWDKRQVG